MNRNPLLSAPAARAKRERGVIIVTLALFLMLLLCFVAFGAEAGRWFLVRAELSKSVDAGALAGARNISNPNVDPRELAQEYCEANFPWGYLGTPSSGAGTPSFDVQLSDGGRIDVTGRTSTPPFLAQVLGFGSVDVSSRGAAQQRPVEIMLVLDRSGSMEREPIADLKVASRHFVDFFAETQAQDKMGMISFATGVTIDVPLRTNFVTSIKSAINQMDATGHTNPEDALDQANGPQGFTNQNGLPPERRTKQFAVFFSDGRPNAFRGSFVNNGNVVDAVAYCQDCDDRNPEIEPRLWSPGAERRLSINSLPTGDGRPRASSACGIPTTRWMIFDNAPIPAYSTTACRIPEDVLADHICMLASVLTIQKAKELKDSGVDVFVIGLGNINEQFLEAIATSPQHVYYSPDSNDLQALFQKVALQIKLRLVA